MIENNSATQPQKETVGPRGELRRRAASAAEDGRYEQEEIVPTELLLLLLPAVVQVQECPLVTEIILPFPRIPA